MKKYLPITFSDYINERVQYLNLSDTKGKNTIAQFDTSNKEDQDKLKRVKSSLLRNELELFLKELLESVNSEFVDIMADQLISLFSSGIKTDASDNLIEDLRKILIQKQGIYNFDMKDGINNSIDSIANHYSKYFEKSFFEKLSKKQLGVRPMTGPMEGLLSLFTDLSFAGGSDRGDLRSDSGQKIEVKARNGRVGGTTSHYLFLQEISKNIAYVFKSLAPSKISISELSDFENKYSEIFNKNKGGFTVKYAKSLVESTNEMYQKLNRNDADKFLHLIGHSLKGYRSKKLTMNEKLGPQEFDVFKSIIQKKSESALIDYKAVVDFMGYKNVDDFEYLLFGVFPTVSKNNIDTKNSFLVIDVKTNNFKSIFNIFSKYVKVTGAAEWHTNGTGITATTKK